MPSPVQELSYSPKIPIKTEHVTAGKGMPFPYSTNTNSPINRNLTRYFDSNDIYGIHAMFFVGAHLCVRPKRVEMHTVSIVPARGRTHRCAPTDRYELTDHTKFQLEVDRAKSCHCEAACGCGNLVQAVLFLRLPRRFAPRNDMYDSSCTRAHTQVRPYGQIRTHRSIGICISYATQPQAEACGCVAYRSHSECNWLTLIRAALSDRKQYQRLRSSREFCMISS